MYNSGSMEWYSVETTATERNILLQRLRIQLDLLQQNAEQYVSTALTAI